MSIINRWINRVLFVVVIFFAGILIVQLTRLAGINSWWLSVLIGMIGGTIAYAALTA